MSLYKFILIAMKKYRFISPMKEKELEAQAVIHRKNWKASMFLDLGSYFDDQNPECGWEDDTRIINMPCSKEDVRKYFKEYEEFRLYDAHGCYKCSPEDIKLHQEICELPENVQIYVAGLHKAIESEVNEPWEIMLSKFFYTQHEWDLFLILDRLQRTSGIYGQDDGPWPLYWFKSRELLFEALHRYPDLIRNTLGRSLPLRIWDQKDFVKEIVNVNHKLFKAAPRHIKESKQKVLEAAEVDGRIIKFIKTKLRNDHDVALGAVCSHKDSKDFLLKKTKIALNII